MAGVGSLELVAFGGVFASASTYVAFALLTETGDPLWHFEKLWWIIELAPLHVLVAWIFFAICAALAYGLRRKLARRPLTASAILVGPPSIWAIGLRAFYYNDSRVWWPSFADEEWRWLVSHIYAEFSFGLLVGFVGLLGFAVSRRSRKG